MKKLVQFFGNLVGGVLSEISLSEEEADKIEKESKQMAEEYVESEEGDKQLPKRTKTLAWSPPNI